VAAMPASTGNEAHGHFKIHKNRRPRIASRGPAAALSAEDRGIRLSSDVIKPETPMSCDDSFWESPTISMDSEESL